MAKLSKYMLSLTAELWTYEKTHTKQLQRGLVTWATHAGLMRKGGRFHFGVFVPSKTIIDVLKNKTKFPKKFIFKTKTFGDRTIPVRYYIGKPKKHSRFQA